MQEREGRVGRAPALVKETVRVVRQLGLPSPSGVTKLPLHRSRPVRMAVRHRDSGAFELMTQFARSVLPECRTGRSRDAVEMMMPIYLLMRSLGESTAEMECILHSTPCLLPLLNIPDASCIPDQSTIHHFQKRLETDDNSRAMLDRSVEVLREEGKVDLRTLLIDSTNVRASSSVKNNRADGEKRDAEMSFTKKNRNFLFGMSLHTVQTGDGVAIAVEGRTAKRHDMPVAEEIVPPLLERFGEEVRELYGDLAYAKQGFIDRLWFDYGVSHHVPHKRKKGESLSEEKRGENRALSSVRCRVEHAYAVLKQVMRYAKARLWGVERNTHRARIVFAIMIEGRSVLMAGIAPYDRGMGGE